MWVCHSTGGIQNQWFLIERPMVSWRDQSDEPLSTEYEHKLNINEFRVAPDDQKHSWIGYREKFDKNRTVIESWNQDFVTPALCHISLWAAGLVTSFVAPAFRENTFWSGVLDSSSQRWSRHSEVGWENERESVRDWRNFRGRPKVDQSTQWNCVRGTGMHWWSDQSFMSLSKWSQMRGKSSHLARGEWFFCSTRQLFEESAILWRDSSILNDFESTTTRVNDWTNEQREFRGIWRQIFKKFDKNWTVIKKESRFRGTRTLPHTPERKWSGFIVFVTPVRMWLSSLSVSLIIQMEIFAWVETIFDHGKRLLSPRRLQSRFRGTTTSKVNVRVKRRSEK